MHMGYGLISERAKKPSLTNIIPVTVDYENPIHKNAYFSTIIIYTVEGHRFLAVWGFLSESSCLAQIFSVRDFSVLFFLSVLIFCHCVCE
jgi:hypothetical protein